MNIKNTDNTEHYKWGENCDGWHLLKSDGLNVIQERVPAGEQECRHYHNRSQQFFYILAGSATMEIAGLIHQVAAGSGIHVPAGEPHQLKNNGTDELEMLVISQPLSHGDRVIV